MKKRLRKKKRIGEFAEKGCRLVVLRKTKDESEAFNDAFIVEAIEGNGCFCGGSLGEDRLDVVLELGRISEGADARFQRVAAWLCARPDVAEWRAGAILDLWHAPAEAFDSDPFASTELQLTSTCFHKPQSTCLFSGRKFPFDQWR